MWLNVSVDTHVANVIGVAMRRSSAARLLTAAFLIATSAAIGSPAAHAQQAEAPVGDLLNYVWRTDPVSKALAGKPMADKVLHRVPGSFFDAPRTPACLLYTSPSPRD